MISPLIRITIGPTRPQGFEVLKLGVEMLRKLYPECEVVICYNQLSTEQISEIRNLTLINQELYTEKYIVTPKQGYQVCWKLYPPRLRPESHELFIDNDIVITHRLLEIDRFLQDDATLLYEGLHGLHGQFANELPSGIRINSGIFGLPPFYDFESEATYMFQKIGEGKWTDHFDEQGLVGSCLLKYPRYYIVPQTKIPIVEPWMDLEPAIRNPLCVGIHFVGINRYEHPGWHEFRRRRIFL